MKVINLSFAAMPDCSNQLVIGRRGENEATQVLVDYSEWIEEYGSGALFLYVLRHSDSAPYPVYLDLNGGIAAWTVSATDTNIQGQGIAEYVYIVDEAIVKTSVFPFYVEQDIGQPASDPPDPYETWIDELTELGAQAEEAALDAIAAKNAAIAAEEGAKAAQQAIEDMTVSAETLEPGSDATVTKTIIENVVHLLFGIPKGQKGDPGTPGATGNGIASIALISTSGLNKTYRITYTNGNHFDYVVKDGEKGDTGNGIYSIYKTGTSGKVDTYTILYTDGNTEEFTVTNGTNGTDGVDGVSPVVTITTITGGHTVTITDATHPDGQSFNVMDGTNTDAEHVTYDSTQTYSSGTVGNALGQLNSEINDIIDSEYSDGDTVTIQKNTAASFALNNPTGYIHVKSTDAPIYTGTINNIDLFHLAQGTFTDSHSGVVIEISGNEIYIHGNASAGFRFNLQTGEFYTDAFTNHLADFSNLPNDNTIYSFCWWEKSDYTAPTNIYVASRNQSTGAVVGVNLAGHAQYSNYGNRSAAYPHYIAIYTNSAINGINIKFTIGLKIRNLTQNEGANIEQTAKAPYGTTIMSEPGYYKLGAFTWTGTNNVYDAVSTTPYLQHDPLTANRTFAWFGDSISQLKELPDRVSALLDVPVYDCTFAGSPLTYGNPTTYQPTGFMSLCSQIVAGDFTPLSDALDAQESAGVDVTEKRVHLATLENLDFNDVTDIIVFAGTNDFDNDYVNATNFVSGFESALTALLTAYPHLMLYVFSPIWRGDKSEGVVTIPTMPDLVNLEKNVADSFSLPFYDLYHRSGINSLTANVYLQNDKLHPTVAGDKLLANKCAKFIQSN